MANNLSDLFEQHQKIEHQLVEGLRSKLIEEVEKIGGLNVKVEDHEDADYASDVLPTWDEEFGCEQDWWVLSFNLPADQNEDVLLEAIKSSPLIEINDFDSFDLINNHEPDEPGSYKMNLDKFNVDRFLSECMTKEREIR